MLSNTIFWVYSGLFIGALGFFWYICKKKSEALRQQFEVDAREERLKSKEERSNLELAFKNREADLERASKGREHELDSRERDLSALEERLERDRVTLKQKEKEIEERGESLDEASHETEKIRRLYKLKLYEVSQMDAESARRRVLNDTEQDCREEILERKRELLGRSDNDIMEEARRILLASMQRITSQPMNDATATLVSLPSEEMKGRIIGREGRNIRTFEHSTGTTLLIDEAPDSVLVSSFDPVRREIARLALESLVRDGRIHPANIEDAVVQAEEEMSASIFEKGENAVRELRLGAVHPEITGVLGKLHYRLSNNQNTLAHSVEVANLCGLIASEIGLDIETAKRAGLFHDIGKALSEEHGGSHAIAGSNWVKRHGEESRVVNAVAAHHKEVPAESAYAGLVMVADSLSAVRPGARTASIDGFIQRVRSIEQIAQEHAGVVEAYAIQAGREVRVIVEPSQVNDEAARTVARNIRKRIENELNYPGSIEVTVIREQRFQETAV